MGKLKRKKKLNKIPLSLILIVPFVIQSVLVVSLVGYLSFKNGQQAVNQVTSQLRNEITTYIEHHLYEFLNIPQFINQSNANALHHGWVNPNDITTLETYLWEQIQVFDSVSSIYFGNIEGGLVDAGREGTENKLYIIVTDDFKSGTFKKYATDNSGNHTDLLLSFPDFDARTRSWYKNAVEQGNPTWNEPYFLFTEQDMAIAASQPVYDQAQNLLGVVSCDIFISNIRNFMQNLKIGQTGSSFIIERSGLMISSSKDESPFSDINENETQKRLYASESNDTTIREVDKFLINQFGSYNNINSTLQLEFEMTNQNQFLQVTPIQDDYGIDWLLIVVIPESDFMAKINVNNQITIMLMGIALVINILIGIVTAKRMTRPIATLITSTQLMAKGKWDQVIHNDRIEEIDNLAHSFNDMAGQLSHTWNALKDEILEHKQAEDALQRSYSELALLNRIIVGTSMTLNTKEVLEIVCRELALTFNLLKVRTALLNKEGTAIIIKSEYLSAESFNTLDVEIPVDSNPVLQYVIKHQKPIIVPDVENDPALTPDQRKYLQQKNIISILLLPLMIRDQVIGVLCLEALEPREFSDSEITLVTNIAKAATQALENTSLFNEATQRLKRLDALHKIDKSIMGTLDLKITLDILLDNLLILLNVDAASILLYDDAHETLIFSQGKGFQTTEFPLIDLKLGQRIAGEVALQKSDVFIQDLSQIKATFSKSCRFKQEGFVSSYGVPLITKGTLVGVLEVFQRAPLKPNKEWIDYLHILAGQAAIAIDNVALYDNLEQSNQDLLQAYHETIEGWALALELRDMETVGHSRRVVETTMDLAKIFGLDEKELGHIYRGALLHDIGKIGIPDSILQKPGKLNQEELKIMRQHTVFAYEWLSSIHFLQPAIDIPYCHHERWDGTGYPRGLKENQIPFSARLFAIVDVWDALQSDRPYRKAWPTEKALAYIKKESGKHFDPEIVTAFLKYLSLK